MAISYILSGVISGAICAVIWLALGGAALQAVAIYFTAGYIGMGTMLAYVVWHSAEVDQL